MVIWDYLLTFSDELRYVWKREKSWCGCSVGALYWADSDDRIAFWVFIIVSICRVLDLEA